MALSIEFDSKNVREWHVGEKNPVSGEEYRAVNNIMLDGDELEYVKNQYTVNPLSHPEDHKRSIPIPSGKRVVYLYGDIAKTIVANL